MLAIQTVKECLQKKVRNNRGESLYLTKRLTHAHTQLTKWRRVTRSQTQADGFLTMHSNHCISTLKAWPTSELYSLETTWQNAGILCQRSGSKWSPTMRKAFLPTNRNPAWLISWIKDLQRMLMCSIDRGTVRILDQLNLWGMRPSMISCWNRGRCSWLITREENSKMPAASLKCSWELNSLLTRWNRTENDFDLSRRKRNVSVMSGHSLSIVERIQSKNLQRRKSVLVRVLKEQDHAIVRNH